MTTTPEPQADATASATELEQSLTELEAMRARAETADATRNSHALEAERIEASAGADLLDADDPEEAERVTARLGQLRASVEVQGRVAAEARQRVGALEARALRAEAAAKEPAAQQATADLERFDAKTERLRKALADHTLYVVKLVDPGVEAQQRMQEGGGGPTSYAVPPRRSLVAAVARAERQVRLCLALAEVCEGTRTIRDLHEELTDPAALLRDPGARVEWIDLPELVQDGTVTVDGLWLRPPAPPRDWQAEYDEQRADYLQAAASVEHVEQGLVSDDPFRRHSAAAADLGQRRRRRDESAARMHTVRAQAEQFGVRVVDA